MFQALFSKVLWVMGVFLSLGQLAHAIELKLQFVIESPSPSSLTIELPGLAQFQLPESRLIPLVIPSASDSKEVRFQFASTQKKGESFAVGEMMPEALSADPIPMSFQSFSYPFSRDVSQIAAITFYFRWDEKSASFIPRVEEVMRERVRPALSLDLGGSPVRAVSPSLHVSRVLPKKDPADGVRLENFDQVSAFLAEKRARFGFKPHQIVIVSDLDGTLTQNPAPSRDYEEPVARLNHPDVLKEWVREGFRVMVSSGYHLLTHSLLRLESLGLAEALDLRLEGLKVPPKLAGSASPMSNMNTNLCRYRLPEEALVAMASAYEFDPSLKLWSAYQVGKFIAVKRNGQFFFQKAFAPYIDLSPADLSEVKLVVFLEDSEDTLDKIRTDIKTYRLFPGVDVQTIHLPLE